jgi:predicted  nucleic acid-binding Zn ribbon protein
MVNVTQINSFYEEEYVNRSCTNCPTGQASWVLHDDEYSVFEELCNRCLNSGRVLR